MKSKNYWEKRAQDISNYEFEKADSYKSYLEKEYREALENIQEDLEAFYNKFAKDNKISILEAKKILARGELKDFKITLDDFIRKAKENQNLQWEKELNNLSNKVRITRLEALQMQVRNALENLYVKQQEGTTGVLEDIYKDAYYRNFYEIHKGLGMVVSFAKLDTNIINKAITEPWHGNNYSSRIWNNKELLIKELQHNLTKAFIRGDSIDKTSKIIANRMNVAIGRARTLVNTESANIASKATFSSYSESGVVKEYEIFATLDLHTSKICRYMDGKVFKVSEKKIGVNAPPLHPNCRSTVIPYFDDAVDEERIARDPVTGETKYVPGNMKYEDWYRENVANNPKTLAEEKKIKNKSSDKKQYEKYKEVLGKEMPRSFDKFQELKYNNINEWNSIKNNFESEFIKKDFEKIPLAHENCSNLLTRKWYKCHDENIPNLIDKTKSIEEQAKQAHNLRNKYRTEARNLMMDQEERRKLDIEHPNKNFEELISDKMNRKKITREQAIADTLKTATVTNKKVNKSLGLE